jgi:thiamine-phosphate pyrophosphorylase
MVMASSHALAAQAARLNREAGAPAIPALFFFTDPERTPDPAAVARRLPRATAIVYRHFGAPERARMARRLAAIARARGLVLLIAADPELARRVGAAGVHWPQRLAPHARGAGLMTVAAHDAQALARAEALGADACVLGPVFATRSASAHPPLGLFRASQLARAARVPVIALGGVSARSAARLAGRGFAGIAAVDAFLSD